MTALKIVAAVYLAHWIIGFEQGFLTQEMRERRPLIFKLYIWLVPLIAVAVVLT